LTDIYSIEVRPGGRRKFFFYFIAFLLILSVGFILPSQRKESIDFFFGKWSFTKLPFFLFFAFLPSLPLYYYLDRGVKVRIDSEGIWSRKYGNMSWEEIWSFSSTLKKGQRYPDIYQLCIRLKDTETRLGEEVTLKFQEMDKRFEEIRPIVEYYARRYKIEDSGHTNLL
jgi:hypothetical protein